MREEHDARRELAHDGDGARRGAELAESVAASFERLAHTYRTIAEGTPSPEKTARMQKHAARLQERAGRERAEAERFRDMLRLRDAAARPA